MSPLIKILVLLVVMCTSLVRESQGMSIGISFYRLPQEKPVSKRPLFTGDKFALLLCCCCCALFLGL